MINKKRDPKIIAILIDANSVGISILMGPLTIGSINIAVKIAMHRNTFN
jgi:hypothetical protein